MEPNTTSRDTERGSSLVELVIASVLAALALGCICLLVMQSSRMRRVDDETNVAMQACRQQLEIMRELPFASLPARSGTGFAIDADRNGVPDLLAVPDDLDGQPGLTTVTAERTSGTEVLLRVNASAVWKGTNGVRSVWVETLIANRSAR